MVKELNIGDRVSTALILISTSGNKKFDNFNAAYVKNRRADTTGKIENYFFTDPRIYLVRHDPVKVKLSSLQEKEISQVAVYREDELFLEGAVNPRKENALIKWLRN